MLFASRVLAGGGIPSEKLPSNENIIYLSPLPGAHYVMTGTNIIIRVAENIDPSSLNNSGILSVTGSLSGQHAGKLILTDDPRTVIFKPDVRFYAGEKVTVKVNDGLKTISGKFATSKKSGLRR